MQAPASDLETRVAALEHQVRTLRGALAVVGFGGAAGVAFAAWATSERPAEAPASPATTLPTDLAVERLAIVDGAGQRRADLGVSEGGAVALSLYAPDGSLRASLQAGEDRAGLSTLGERGATRTWLGWSRPQELGDRAELQLRDRSDRTRLDLHASDAVPGITLYNDAGVPMDVAPR